LSVLARARIDDPQRASWSWLSAAAFVAGASMWATHFVALLSFQTGLPVGFGIWPTALSIAVAISASWLAFAAAHYLKAPIFGGALFGAAIAAMHFTGMAGLSLPARVHWDTSYVAASVFIGAALGAAALSVFARGLELGWRMAAAVLLMLAITGLHFTAMAALNIDPDPRVPLDPNALMLPEWFAIVVNGIMAMIIVFGLSASKIDHHLAERAIVEAARLRSYVSELEKTKHELQATTIDLRRAFEAAAAGSQAKSQFLATMSHELRTPLNAIIGFSEVMAQEMLGPHGNARYKEYAASVLASGQHLLDLIMDILDFSKIEAGRLDLQKDVIDANQTVQSALRMTRGQADDAGVRLDDALSLHLPSVYADERRLRQVLLNLLSNAIKFTPGGGKVLISSTQTDRGIAITVSDNGIGMAPEDIPRALELFGQVDNSLERKYEGTGLGLPLSKRLVELHGGTLEIESALDVGTTVTVTLPSEQNMGALPEPTPAIA
jgi:signal transduction histidine kinase